MAQKKKVPAKAATRAKAAKTEARAPKKKAATAKSTAKAPVRSATRTKKAATTTSGRKAAPATKTAAAKKSPATKKPAAAKKPARKVAAKPAAKATKPVVAAKKAPAKPVAKASTARSRAAGSTARKTAASAKPVAASRPAQKTKLKAVAASAAKAPVKRQPAAENAKPAAKPAAAAPKKPVAPKPKFKTGEFIVYPAHGVGEIIAIEEQEIAGMTLELFVITFEKDKMTLRVPTAKLESVGMRKLAATDVVEKALTTLKGRARVKRTMWSRRAQEYEQKINSGDLISIAEVVRDLYRSETQPEQSYSERQLYEAALDRMARELSAVENLDERGAVQRITDVLAKSAKGRRLAEEAAQEAEAAASDNNKAA